MPSATSRSAEISDTRFLVPILVYSPAACRWAVALVVPEAPVADEVDQHVVAELLAEGEREPHGADARRHVVGVHVDDRHVEALREVRGPARRARVVGIGGEPDLVVGDQVDGAPDLVPVERRRSSVSGTTPWPGNDASPWIMIGTAALVSWWAWGLGREVWAARVAPSTTARRTRGGSGRTRGSPGWCRRPGSW